MSHRAPSPAAGRKLTEREAAAELGLDRLQLHLAASANRVGRYDPVSHLLVFSDEEIDRLAELLGIKRRRQGQLSAEQMAKVPEPNAE